jgi:hypothetical protein
MRSLLGVKWRQNYFWFVNMQNFENVGDQYSFIKLQLCLWILPIVRAKKNPPRWGLITRLW